MISILLLTYNRLDYAMVTLSSTLKNIFWPVDDLHVHIADDGSPAEHRDRLVTLARDSGVQNVTVTNGERGGYGHNYNLALQVVHHYSDVVLPLEDDWKLTRPLYIEPLLAALKDERVGCIRLGYLGFTQRLLGEVFAIDEQHYLLLDPQSDEPHVFAGHPRLETAAWERSVGPWPEGLLPGETEVAVAYSLAARMGVVWPMSMVRPCGDLFVHIGTERSY